MVISQTFIPATELATSIGTTAKKANGKIGTQPLTAGTKTSKENVQSPTQPFMLFTL